VPCFGVHPWWLHELTEQDWEEQQQQRDGDDDDIGAPKRLLLPRWILELEELLLSHPEAAVGETGLDAFHFDPVTRELVSPVETTQVQAFRLQLQLAVRHQRPVSVHCVQAWGPLMRVLSEELKKSSSRIRQQLLPAIYFHAFGGKVGTVDQLTALCRSTTTGGCYFGFAPVVNFRSPKTADVVRKVGIDRLLLETDHEDAALVPESIQEGIRFLAEALDMEPCEVVERTTANAFAFYGIETETSGI